MDSGKRKRRFIAVWVTSGLSALLLVLEQLLSAYREEILGLDPRVAGHNFAYNFTYFFPAVIVSFLLSFAALFLFLRARALVRSSGSRLTWLERCSLTPALVPLLGLLYIVGTIVYFASKW